jgi:outer membrane protein assembly factor BamB
MRVALLLFPLALSIHAADWPQFLGPTRDLAAAADEKPLSDAEPTALWKHAVGSGQGGPAIAQGRVVIAHRVANELIIEALDLRTGAVQWKQSRPTAYRDDFGMDNGPRAVPAIAADRVFVHGADGRLDALSLTDGKLLWSVETAALGSPQGYFGRACSPLIIGDQVVITPGAPGGNAVAAFEVITGKLGWNCGDDEASYASPVMAGGDLMLCWLRDHLTSIDVKAARVLHRERFRPAIDASVSAATPIRTDQGWFVTAEYDVGAALWELASDGTLKKSWSGGDAISAHYATPLYHDGHVYGFDGRQERGMTLRCWSTATREVKWESPRVTGGTLLRVADRLAVVTEGGELWIIKASPTGYEVLRSAQIMRAGHRSYAAYSDGVLCVRDGEHLHAVKVD